MNSNTVFGQRADITNQIIAAQAKATKAKQNVVHISRVVQCQENKQMENIFPSGFF